MQNQIISDGVKFLTLKTALWQEVRETANYVATVAGVFGGIDLLTRRPGLAFLSFAVTAGSLAASLYSDNKIDHIEDQLSGLLQRQSVASSLEP